MPDCVALAIETPHGVDRAHRRLQDRSDAARRRALRLPSARASWARRACWRCSPTARTSTGAGSPGRRSRSSTRSRRSSRARRERSSWRCSPRASTGCRSWWTWRRSSTAGWRSSAAGVIENSEIAQRLGYLRMPAGVQIRDSDVRSFPAQDVVCICTGSQGEPQAALPRIAIDDHRHVKLGSRTTSWCSRPGRFRATRRRSAG